MSMNDGKKPELSLTEAVTITQAYGGFLGKGAPIIADASLLPYPKEKIQQAMLVYEQHLCDTAKTYIAAGLREKLPQIDEILLNLRSIRGYLESFTNIEPNDVDEVRYFNSYSTIKDVPLAESSRCLDLQIDYMSKGMEEEQPGWTEMADDVGKKALKEFLKKS